MANKTALFSNGDIINVDTQDRQQPELAEAADRMAIFAYYSNGTGNNLASWSTQRLYSFKVRRGGKLIHDWIPVRTPQGVVTLYDLVANEALTPLGTGAFIAGPAVNTGVEIAPIPVQTLPANGACTPAPVVTQAGTGVRATHCAWNRLRSSGLKATPSVAIAGTEDSQRSAGPACFPGA